MLHFEPPTPVSVDCSLSFTNQKIMLRSLYSVLYWEDAGEQIFLTITSSSYTNMSYNISLNLSCLTFKLARFVL